jgi:hypothetical protein
VKAAMRFAYADPPYLGQGTKHYGDRHENAGDFDHIAAHRALIERLTSDYPDGWALSASSPSLRVILPMCPDDCRVAAWVKPFASFKKGVGVAYAWEPVIFRGGRKRALTEPTTRDWLAENITLQRGFPGAKPRAFCMWIMDMLHVQCGDTVDDLFPGSGAVGHAIAERLSIAPEPFGLFSETWGGVYEAS